LDGKAVAKSFGSGHGYCRKDKLLFFDVLRDLINSLFYRAQFGFDPGDGVFSRVSPFSFFFVECIENLYV
jgi:hypothetical protein